MSSGYRSTTNNRMEIMTVVAGLQTLKEKCRVTVYSDSRYVVDAMDKGWARRWEARGWKTERGFRKNADLRALLLELCELHQVVEFRWVEAHAGNPENEHCDQLAKKAALGRDLLPDEGYETIILP